MRHCVKRTFDSSNFGAKIAGHIPKAFSRKTTADMVIVLSPQLPISVVRPLPMIMTRHDPASFSWEVPLVQLQDRAPLPKPATSQGCISFITTIPEHFSPAGNTSCRYLRGSVAAFSSQTSHGANYLRLPHCS
jgi:hypothetical protein